MCAFNITAKGYTQQTVTQTMTGTRTLLRVRIDKVAAVTTGAPIVTPTVEQMTEPATN